MVFNLLELWQGRATFSFAYCGTTHKQRCSPTALLVFTRWQPAHHQAISDRHRVKQVSLIHSSTGHGPFHMTWMARQ